MTNKKSILLVEDQYDERMALCDTLNSWGFDVTAVGAAGSWSVTVSIMGEGTEGEMNLTQDGEDVTGDLTAVEKVLMKWRDHFISVRGDLADQGILVRDIGDPIVDGVTGGRNKMIMDLSIRAQGQWTQEQQDAIVDALGTKYVRGFKKFKG